jgi:hypothetical protein
VQSRGKKDGVVGCPGWEKGCGVPGGGESGEWPAQSSGPLSREAPQNCIHKSVLKENPDTTHVHKRNRIRAKCLLENLRLFPRAGEKVKM